MPCLCCGPMVVPSGVALTAAAGLGRGERAPDMVLASRDGTPTRYYAHAGGRPALLVPTRRVWRGWTRWPRGWGHRRRGADRARGRPARAGRPRPAVSVAPGRRRSCRGRLLHRGAPTAFLLDPNLRVGAKAAARRRRPRRRRRRRRVGRRAGLGRPATARSPPRRHCWCAGRARAGAVRRSHRRVGAGGPQGETGVESSTGSGRAEQRNAQLKRRRDHVVQDPQRSRELAATIGRRVLLELSKAFAYRASRFEGFKIACYQASDAGSSAPPRQPSAPPPRTVGSRWTSTSTTAIRAGSQPLSTA